MSRPIFANSMCPSRKYRRMAPISRPQNTAAAAREMTAMKMSEANSCSLYMPQIVRQEVG